MIRLIITAFVVRASLCVNDHKVGNNAVSQVKESVRRLSALQWLREPPHLSSARKQSYRKGKSLYKSLYGLRNSIDYTPPDGDNGLGLESGYSAGSGLQNGAGFLNNVGYQSNAGLPNDAGFLNNVGYQSNAGLPNDAGFLNNVGFQSNAGLPNDAGFLNNVGFQSNAGLQNSAGLQNGAGLPSGAGFLNNAGLLGGTGLQSGAGLQNCVDPQTFADLASLHQNNPDPKQLWRLWKTIEKKGRLIAARVIENPDPTLKDLEPHQVAVIYALVDLSLKLGRTCSTDEYVSTYQNVVGTGLMEGFEHPKDVARRLNELLDLVASKTERIHYANSENFVPPDYGDEDEKEDEAEAMDESKGEGDDEDGDYDGDVIYDGDYEDSACTCEDTTASSDNNWGPWSAVFEVIIRPKQVFGNSGPQPSNNCQRKKNACQQDSDGERRHRKRKKGRGQKATPLANKRYLRQCCGDKSTKAPKPPTNIGIKRSPPKPNKPTPKPYLTSKENELQSALSNLAIQILLSQEVIMATRNFDEVNHLLNVQAPINIFNVVHAGAVVLQLLSNQEQCDLNTVTLADVNLHVRPPVDTPSLNDADSGVGASPPQGLGAGVEDPEFDNLGLQYTGPADQDVGSGVSGGLDGSYGGLLGGESQNLGSAFGGLNLGTQGSASGDVPAGDIGVGPGGLDVASGGLDATFGGLDTTFGGQGSSYGGLDAGIQDSISGDLDAGSGGLDATFGNIGSQTGNQGTGGFGYNLGYQTDGQGAGSAGVGSQAGNQGTGGFGGQGAPPGGLGLQGGPGPQTGGQGTGVVGGQGGLGPQGGIGPQTGGFGGQGAPPGVLGPQGGPGSQTGGQGTGVIGGQGGLGLQGGIGPQTGGFGGQGVPSGGLKGQESAATQTEAQTSGGLGLGNLLAKKLGSWTSGGLGFNVGQGGSKIDLGSWIG